MIPIRCLWSVAVCRVVDSRWFQRAVDDNTRSRWVDSAIRGSVPGLLAVVFAVASLGTWPFWVFIAIATTMLFPLVSLMALVVFALLVSERIDDYRYDVQSLCERRGVVGGDE